MRDVGDIGAGRDANVAGGDIYIGAGAAAKPPSRLTRVLFFFCFLGFLGGGLWGFIAFAGEIMQTDGSFTDPDFSVVVPGAVLLIVSFVTLVGLIMASGGSSRDR